MEGVLDLREKLAKLMYGRYGVDQLGRAMLIFALVLCVLSLFVPRRLSGIIYYISLILIILMYIRMFSKNIQKRYQENNKYLSLKASFLRKFQREKEIFSQRRFYHFTDVHVADSAFVFLVAKAASKSVVQNVPRHLLKKVRLSDA